MSNDERVIEILEEEMIDELESNPQKVKDLGKVKIAIEITDLHDGRWIFDFNKATPVIKRSAKGDADLSIKLSSEDFIDLYEKKLDAQKAFFTGRVKIDGNLGLALKLKNLF